MFCNLGGFGTLSGAVMRIGVAVSVLHLLLAQIAFGQQDPFSAQPGPENSEAGTDMTTEELRRILIADDCLDDCPLDEIDQIFSETWDADTLCLDKDDSIALAASWEKCVQALKLRYLVLDYREERRAQVSRHMGLINGRFRVSIPTGWQKAIESVQVHSSWSPMTASKEDYKEVVAINFEPIQSGVFTGECDEGLGAIIVSGFKASSVERNSEGVRVARIESLATRRSVNVEVSRDPGEMYAVAEDSDVVAVARASQVHAFGPYRLAVYRLTSDGISEIVSQLERNGWRNPLSGFLGQPDNPVIERSIRDGRVFVFGSSIGSVFVDVVDLKTGEVQASFHSAF